MLPLRLRQHLRAQRLATGLGGFGVGVLAALVTEWLVVTGGGLLWLVVGIAVIATLAAINLWARRPPGVEVVVSAPQTIRSDQEARRYARRGLICIVPLYRPGRGSPAAAHLPEKWLEAAQEHEWALLQPEASNLLPVIKAIRSHASRLEHCWLIATSGEPTVASASYVPALAAYLREDPKINAIFYYGSRYQISLGDDSEVVKKTYDLVREIVKEAQQRGILPGELIADVTSGMRSLALGMTLASLDREQDLQFVGTRYDAKGDPVGEPFPIIYNFEPILDP